MSNKIGGQIGNLGMQTGMNIIDRGMGLLFGDDKKQIKQQQKLTDMGTAQSKELMEAARQNQMKMWDETNFAAQMQQMRKAGLNPAMMYAGGGEGGTTGSFSSGGNIAGNASSESDIINADVNRRAMGLELRKAEAEIKAMEAGANKDQAEADATQNITPTKIKGLETDIEHKKTSIKEITQNIENKKIQADGAKLQNDFDRIRNEIKNMTAGDEIQSARYMNYKLEADVNTILQNYEITKEQKIDIIEAGRMNVQNLKVDLLVKASNMQLNEAQARKVLIEAENHVRGLDIKESSVDASREDTKMKETVAYIMKTKPNIWNVAGDGLERAINSFEKMSMPFDWALRKLGVEIFDNKYLNE